MLAYDTYFLVQIYYVIQKHIREKSNSYIQSLEYNSTKISMFLNSK